MRLPLLAAGAGEPAPAEGPGGREAAAVRHVLVVEDNTDAREMLRDLLLLLGHRVDTAADGPAGVDLALANCPDVALIDIGLPGLNGYEVARRIRAASRRVSRIRRKRYDSHFAANYRDNDSRRRRRRR